jgi:hypothetical protein
MSGLKRMGLLFIIAGAFIPSVLYPFATPTTSATLMQLALSNQGGLYQPRLNQLEIVFKEGTWIKEANKEGYHKGRIAIPYHYTIAGGITIAFLGIALIAITNKKIKNNYA